MPNALARKYKLQVSADNISWLNVAGLNDLNPSENPTLQGADTYDTNGFNAFEKTMTGWTVGIKFIRPIVASVYDPGQELIRLTRFQFGVQARLYVRWFDRNGAVDAYSGLALIDWNPSKTGVGDIEEVAVKFTGDGIVTPITNPYNVAVVPVITSVSPTGIGAGGTVAIYGQNFTGVVATTGVKFGGVNATSFSFQNDGLIIAVLPAGSAGLITVLVTNATGPSVQVNNYTRIV